MSAEKGFYVCLTPTCHDRQCQVLENLILVLYEMTGPITPDRIEILKKVKEKLKEFRAFVQREVNCLKDMDFSDFAGSNSSAETEEIFRCVEYIAIHLKRMTDPKRRVKYRRTVLSFAVRLKAGIKSESCSCCVCA